LISDGEIDWMSPETPQKLVRDGLMPPGSEIHFVPNAGHQLFLDNPEAFNARVIEEMTKQ
jgi:pimeloyl-ACP methyl ester carboxylesterase